MYAEKNLSGLHCGFKYDTDGGNVVCTPTMNVCAMGVCKGTNDGNLGHVCRVPKLFETHAAFTTVETVLMTQEALVNCKRRTQISSRK